MQLEEHDTGVRDPETVRKTLDEVERLQKSMRVCDQAGNPLATVYYDPDTGDVREIHTEYYENVEKEAEHSDELVYCTDYEGNITSEKLTRKQVREKEHPYLVVTSLLFHGDDVLLQQRSKEKEIDPDALSSSAHGVAKQIFTEDGKLITDMRRVAFTNAALEINEELRHGKDTKPFNVKIFPGNERELLQYLYAEKIDDPNTVYLVSPVVFPGYGYPFKRHQNHRTRFITMGHISSKSKPDISLDKAEVAEIEWCPLDKFVEQKNMTADVRSCLETMYERFLRQRTHWGFHHSHRWVMNKMQRLFGSYPDWEDPGPP